MLTICLLSLTLSLAPSKSPAAAALREPNERPPGVIIVVPDPSTAPDPRASPSGPFTLVVPDASTMVYVAGGPDPHRTIRDALIALISVEQIDDQLPPTPGGASQALVASMLLARLYSGFVAFAEIDPTLEFVTLITRGEPGSPDADLLLCVPRAPDALGDPLTRTMQTERLRIAELPESFRAQSERPDPFPLTAIAREPVTPLPASGALGTLSVAAWATLCQERGYELAMLSDAPQTFEQTGIDPEIVPEPERRHTPVVFERMREALRFGIALDADAAEIHMWFDFDERRQAVAFLNAWNDFVRQARADNTQALPIPEPARAVLDKLPRGRATIEPFGGQHSAWIRFEIAELQPFYTSFFIEVMRLQQGQTPREPASPPSKSSLLRPDSVPPVRLR